MSANAPEATQTPAEPILLYDGSCGFCHRMVKLVLKHEKTHELRFAPLQSEIGQKLLSQYQLPMDLSTVVLVSGARAYTRSSASIRVGWLMGGLASLLASLVWLVPLPLRNLGYKLIAKSRYSFFGKLDDACMLPSPEQRARFLLS